MAIVGVGLGKWVFDGYKVSVLKDENVPEICYTTMWTVHLKIVEGKFCLF